MTCDEPVDLMVIEQILEHFIYQNRHKLWRWEKANIEINPLPGIGILSLLNIHLQGTSIYKKHKIKSIMQSQQKLLDI